MKIGDIVRFKDGHVFFRHCFDGMRFEVTYISPNNCDDIGLKAVKDFRIKGYTGYQSFNEIFGQSGSGGYAAYVTDVIEPFMLDVLEALETENAGRER